MVKIGTLVRRAMEKAATKAIHDFILGHAGDEVVFIYDDGEHHAPCHAP